MREERIGQKSVLWKCTELESPFSFLLFYSFREPSDSTEFSFLSFSMTGPFLCVNEHNDHTTTTTQMNVWANRLDGWMDRDE